MPGSSDTIALKRPLTAAICGNPNSGKTTIFNALTGLRQKVGNYSGVTVERVSGHLSLSDAPDSNCVIFDIPGSYSLAAFSPDEYIAARALFGGIEGEERPDIIICVIDATNLERSLYLLFQVIEFGRPVVVALNMVDLAEKRGLKVDSEALSKELGGIPVVATVGSRGKGISELKRAVATLAARPTATAARFYDPFTVEMLERLSQGSRNGGPARPGHPGRAEYVRILFDENGPAEKAFKRRADEEEIEILATCRRQLREKFGSLSVGETAALMTEASRIGDLVAKREVVSQSFSHKIDRYVLHPILGPAILLAILVLIFQAIFSWSAPLMNVIDSVFSALAGVVGSQLADGPLRSLITDGIIGGVGSVLIFLPQIVILFGFIAVLEDSGYLPRAAFIVDRLFGWCGLSGKSLIPMLSSFACAVPGIMATRTIEDKKLRFITIMMLPLMSCSARLPVYTIMIAAFIPSVVLFGPFNLRGMVLTALYMLGLVVAIIVSFILKKTLNRGGRGSFMMELPSYKLPTFQSVSIRVVNRARAFLVRAGTVILAITIIIWAASYYPHSDDIGSKFSQERSVVTANFESKILLESVFESEISRINQEEAGAYLGDSYLGRIGKTVQPLFEPLGWDWKITMATLASFPAREVIIATLGTIYNLGSDVDEGSSSLMDKMRLAKWESGPRMGQPVFTPAVALSVMVFFALCAQCAATLVTMRQETGSLLYPIASFVWMTTMAYGGAFVVYQLFSRWGF